MHEKHDNNLIRRIIDVCMTVLLLFLMAYQVTGEVLHEWIGMVMLLFWAFTGAQCSRLCMRSGRKEEK